MLASTLLGVVCLALLRTVSAAYAITGPQGGVNTASGQRPFRQEFSTFQNAGAAFDLYILSLQKFQRTGQTNLLSYYQVAGIHGYPNIPWDGVNGGSFSVGYCTHASILFPTWHRPYLALFEQILWNNAKTIAATYPTSNRARYEAAAVGFRMPYWDWAINPSMPDLVSNPKISINTPSGQRSIDNPLFNYTFHPQPSAPDFPQGDGFSQYRSTVRYPDSNGQSQPALVNSQMRSNGQSLHDSVYQLFASQPDYAPFSNTGYSDGRGGDYNNVENLHNIVHSLIGNGGHMGVIPYAAFDPIFWLHHTNVDRIVAIWQALNPNSYTTPQVDVYGSYTNRQGLVEDINTPLTPFHSSSGGTLYTSTTARSTRTFGYSYPEVVDWNLNGSSLASNVRQAVNKLYNPTGSISPRSRRLRKKRMVSGNGADYQWVVNIRADKTLIPTSLFLHFYLSPPPDDPATWSFAPTLIASQSVILPPPSAPLPDSSSLSKSNTTETTTPNPFSHGQIALTHALIPVAENLTPAIVLELLKAKLVWRAQAFDDSIVDRKLLAGGAVRVEVAGRSVEQKGGSEFPVYGDWQVFCAAELGAGAFGQL